MKPDFWKEKTARFYDQAWDFSGGLIKGPVRYFPILNFLKGYFDLNFWPDSQRSVLEIGCAAGRFNEALQLAGVSLGRYEGLDLSPHHIARARELYPETTFHLGSSSESGLADQGFNAVVAVDVVIHNWDVPALLKDWDRLAAHCLIVAARTIVDSPSIKARQGEEGVPYHIINLDVLRGWFNDLKPDYTIALPYPSARIEIGGDVYNLPADFDQNRFGHHTFFAFKNLPEPAASYVQKVAELTAKNPAVLWGSAAGAKP